MLFNSYEFLFLFFLTFIAYYARANLKWQLSVLIFSSFIFYAYYEPWLLTLLIISILINTVSSFFIAKNKSPKLWAWVGVCVNLAILLFFKYSGLIASSLFSQGFLKNDVGHILMTIPLPIGISFFTFQGISLIVDVYKNPSDLRLGSITTFQSHLQKTAMFKAFFPQLIAGPIVKAHDFYFQIKPKLFAEVPWEKALKYLILGYFLKCVIADNIKDQTFWIVYPYFTTISSVDLIVMLFGYSAQIFADFSGYSYIALGLAYLFGYELIKNFNWPYISTSFSEFWRRWHISLSTFLKEYLYIPLGGNQKGELRTYLNLFIVMFLGGLWHGAAWSYAVWGTVHGVALGFERLLGFHRKSSKNCFVLAFKMMFVFTFVTWAWLLFRLPVFSQAVEYVQATFENYNLPVSKMRLLLCLVYIFPVFAIHMYYLVREKIPSKYRETVELLAYAAMLFLILTNMGGVGEFIYFQF